MVRGGEGGAPPPSTSAPGPRSVWAFDDLDEEGLRQLQGEELERFEAYRRSAIPKGFIKKLLTNLTGHAPDVTTTIVACGIAKLLVGELVEASKRVARAGGSGSDAPVTVGDLRRAYTLTLDETALPLQRKRRRLM